MYKVASSQEIFANLIKAAHLIQVRSAVLLVFETTNWQGPKEIERSTSFSNGCR